MPDDVFFARLLKRRRLWIARHDQHRLAQHQPSDRGHVAGKPMSGTLVTATLPANLYDGKKYPSRVHVARSAGGPLLNLITGILLLVVDRQLGGNQPAFDTSGEAFTPSANVR